MVNSKDVNEINSLIVAQLAAEKNKTAIPIVKIDRDYREETGERIPFAKLGYQKLVDYLKTVPGVEVTEMYNAHYVNFIGTEDSQHIVDLVSKQRSKYPPRNTRNYTRYSRPSSNSFGSRISAFSKRTNENIAESIISILRRHSNGLTRAELLRNLNYEYALHENSISLNDHLKFLGKRIIIRDRLIYENTAKKTDNSRSSVYHDHTSLIQTNNFDTNHQSTSSNHMAYSNSIIEDLDYNDNIDPKDNGIYVAENDLIHEIKVSDCNNHYNGEVEEYLTNYSGITDSYQYNAIHESLAYPENSENFTDTNNLREYIFSQNKDYVSTVMSKRVKFRLEKLIQSHPQGIWCTELPKLYEEEYKIPLEWTNLGFHRLSDFTAHLSDIFHVVGPQLNGDFKLYDAKEPLTDDKPTEKSKKLTTASVFDVYGDVDTEPIPTSVPASFSKQLCPDDVITIEETVGQVLVTDINITNNLDKNENPMVEVEVVEAYSPSFFWIRLLKNKNKFTKMMKSLGEFYSANYQRYAVPIIMLERGLNIACVYYEKWHRAIIKSVDPNCMVTVLFYDYGTVDKYPSSEIFYLHRSFTVLPAQAVPCGLYSVAPHEGDKWPKRIRDWFTQWVCDRPMWANIVEVDVEKNSILVTLADTSGKDDFFVNDWLIDKKMAKVKKMGCVDPEDMNLYLGDLCEYYSDENGVVETIISTTRRPESNGGMNSSISKSSKIVISSNKLELYESDWKAFKIQVRKRVDEFIMLTMRLTNDFAKKNMRSDAYGIIQNFLGESLTDSMLEMTHSMMDSNSQAVFPEVANTSAASNESTTEQDNHSNVVEMKKVAITFKSAETINSASIDISASNSSNKNDSSDEELSIVDISQATSSSSTDIGTKRSKLENSIKKAANQFFEKKSINESENLTDKKSNSFTESFHDTNPFRNNLYVNGIPEKDTTEPPPLPPRPLNMVSKNDFSKNMSVNYQLSSSKIVYEAPPVMYGSLKNSLRLNHLNEKADNVWQRNTGSQNIESINGQTISTKTLIEKLENSHIRNYLHPLTSENPFESSQ